MPDREIFFIKQNDLLPALEVQFLKPDGVPHDLTGAAVKFLMSKRGAATPKVAAAATITDALQGKARYDWVLADVDTSDDWLGEFQVTFPSTQPQTFPNDDYFIVRILRELGS